MFSEFIFAKKKMSLVFSHSWSKRLLSLCLFPQRLLIGYDCGNGWGISVFPIATTWTIPVGCPSKEKALSCLLLRSYFLSGSQETGLLKQGCRWVQISCVWNGVSQFSSFHCWVFNPGPCACSSGSPTLRCIPSQSHTVLNGCDHPHIAFTHLLTCLQVSSYPPHDSYIFASCSSSCMCASGSWEQLYLRTLWSQLSDQFKKI